MAARSLTRTLTLTRLPSSGHLLAVRRRSSLPEKLIDPVEDAEREQISMKKLEEAVHRVVVKKSEPIWVPLVPGASYWVPPEVKDRGFSQVVGRLAGDFNGKRRKNGVSSQCGWPSSAHFFKEAPLEGETTSKRSSQSEDEEK